MRERSYERAAQARREGDPAWRDYMPIRWHISRHWGICWPVYATIAALLIAIAAMLWRM